MNDTNMIDSCQAHLTVPYASNTELIRQNWHRCCNWQGPTPVAHVNALLAVHVSRWLFGFFFLHSDKTPINFILNSELFCFINFEYFDFCILDTYNKM